MDIKRADKLSSIAQKAISVVSQTTFNTELWKKCEKFQK